MNTPKYNGPTILNLEMLAEIQEMPVTELKDLIFTARRCYRANSPVIKPDGNIRQIYTVLAPLDLFQRRIVDNIFQHVKFPPYLQGSIKADEIDRGYIENANLHAKYRFIVRDDIKNFFQSVTYKLILRIWQDFFGFPFSVASALAQTTSYNGFLPQGASTSSCLANLAFWDREYLLVSLLEQNSYFYTRFVDDVNISSNTRLDKAAVTLVREKVYAMFRSNGLRPNRKKSRVQTRSSKKTVNNLNISSGRATMDEKERLRIRAAVRQCEEMAKITKASDEYMHLYNTTLGRVMTMNRLHKHEAKPYRERLRAIEPSLGH